MSALSFWVVEAMVASALLMIVVLALRGLVRRVSGPQVAYALWALPLLRLALPPLPGGWHRTISPIGRAGETLVLIATPAGSGAASAPVAGWAGQLVLALVWCWAAGAVAFLLYHVVDHRRVCRRILAHATQVDTVDGIRIIRSEAAMGPLAFGVWRRVVAFPADMADRFDADERALALAHEIGHHRRGDLLANWAALAVLALHWPNPLAWLAFRAFRADQELATDARVLAGRSAADRHAYARALVKAAQGGAVSATCHLHTIADLKGRLKMLTISPTSRRRLAVGGGAVGALLVAGLGLTASGSSAAAITARVQQAVAAPEPPAPPAPPAPTAPASHRISRVKVTHDGVTTIHDDLTSADIDAHIAAGDRVEIEPAVPGSKRMIVKMTDDPRTLVEVQDVPAVSTAACGIGSGAPASMVIDSGGGAGRRIVVCTDRIRQVAASANASAGSARAMERDAYAQALAGLLDARTKAVADTGMSDADRARALGAIDTSIAEMRGQLARFN